MAVEDVIKGGNGKTIDSNLNKLTPNIMFSEHVDILFPALGDTVPIHHGYSLYGAVSRIVPQAHGSKCIGLFPIRGSAAGNGTLMLTRHSAVRVRLPATQLTAYLPLAGQSLELDGHRLRLGVPHVAALIPAPTLVSDLVLIKLAHANDAEQAGQTISPDAFLTAARKQLTALQIAAEPHIQLTHTGPRAGQPRRRIIKVKHQTHAGYAMVVDGLTAEESLRLQECGLGGRRLMGCGLFFAVEKEVTNAR